MILNFLLLVLISFISMLEEHTISLNNQNRNTNRKMLKIRTGLRRLTKASSNDINKNRTIANK